MLLSQLSFHPCSREEGRATIWISLPSIFLVMDLFQHTYGKPLSDASSEASS